MNPQRFLEEALNAESRATRHAAHRARKKAAVDAAIARATESRGVLLVLTGNGKGTSSAAFSWRRALGHSVKVVVFQFIQRRNDTGE